jgi:hypothetical protein
MIVGTVRAAMRAEFPGATRLEDAVREAFGVLEAGLENRATTSRGWLVETPARRPLESGEHSGSGPEGVIGR